MRKTPDRQILSYRDLLVWQKAIELVIAIYELTKHFPKEEIYGLVSQIKRAAVSIPANIAEGRSRRTRRDFVQFLKIAYASSAELETHLEIAKRLKETKNIDYSKVDLLLKDVMKMLNKMISKLKAET
ncbi:MAG: four helix bundle protein [Candidatus Parcubacteria bacterium]|nr:MAG: four helix bundle protein [Candidatus Parcubacteria bacterium]